MYTVHQSFDEKYNTILYYLKIAELVSVGNPLTNLVRFLTGIISSLAILTWIMFKCCDIVKMILQRLSKHYRHDVRILKCIMIIVWSNA